MSQPDDQDFYSRYLNPQPAGDPEVQSPDHAEPDNTAKAGGFHLGGVTSERYTTATPEGGGDGSAAPAHAASDQAAPEAAEGHLGGVTPERYTTATPEGGGDRNAHTPADQFAPRTGGAQHWTPGDPPPAQYPPQRFPPQHYPPQQERPQQERPQQEPPQHYPPQQERPQQERPQHYPPQQERPQQERPQQEPPQQEPPQQERPQQERPQPYPPPQQERLSSGPEADSGRHHYTIPPVVHPPSASVGNMRAEVRQADLVRPYKPVPEIGWRKKLHQVTRINTGVGPAEREWIDLKRRLRVNLRGTYFIAVMQQKGGVSKTTGTVGLGEALARYRDDKVVAIDANPANGNLASRVDEPSTGTWRSLIADPNLLSYTDFRHYLGKDSSTGLEVLGSDAGDDVLTGKNLIQAWDKLSRQYPVGLIDCGNQMRDDITAAILSHVDAVVVVSTTRFDGASGAQNTLNWLIAHGYPHLVRSAVMMISNVNKVTPSKAVKNLHDGFGRVVRAVHDIPYDPHLSDATAINFDRLAPATRRAFIETAASVVDGFAGAADKHSGYDGGGRR